MDENRLDDEQYMHNLFLKEKIHKRFIHGIYHIYYTWNILSLKMDSPTNNMHNLFLKEHKDSEKNQKSHIIEYGIYIESKNGLDDSQYA